MQLSHKDKSLLLLIATTIVVLWVVFTLFTRLFIFANFKNSDIAKLAAQPNQEWFNVSRPLALDDFKDRVILLDFWTYSCVTCIQALPEIKKFEERFGSKLLVIGVHSAHFTNDSNSSAVKKAVLKYGINFPVVNDPQLKIWNDFKVKAWPSFALIGPNGNLEKLYSGPDQLDQIKVDVKKLLTKYQTKITREPLPILLERHNTIGNVLSFPTKIEYAANFSYKSRHLPVFFIANSAQNNIIVSSLTGDIIVKIGSGKDGFIDGNFETAAFSDPHGLLFDGNDLYVADSGNNALRVVNFKEGTVETLIGSGAKGRVIESILEAKDVNLSFPSDLEFFPNKNTIAIANTGSNQILTYNLKNQTVAALASDLAQTADLSAFGGKLYFIDAFNSSFRVVDQNGEVKTLLDSELQHPLGLLVDDTGAYIVDSYNHKIRKFDFARKKLNNFTGIKIQLDEPEGIVAVLDRFYLVDSNNNRILSINRGNLNVEILDVMPPLKLPKEGFLEYLPNLQTLKKLIVKRNEEIPLKIDLQAGWKINEEGPSFINLLELTGSKKADLVASFDWNAVKEKTIKLPKMLSDKKYLLQGTIYYCEDKKNALCYIRSYEAKISAEGEGASEMKITLGDTGAQK